MQSELRRAVGRLVFARNSTVALNFMPLKPFHLDVAQDASLIMALRSLRETGNRTLVDQVRIGQWMDRLALRELAAAIQAAGPSPLSVIEVGAGCGALFEYLKSAGETELTSYMAIGPANEGRRFEVLHGSDSLAFDYAETLPPQATTPSLLILNQNQAIRYGHGCDLDWLAAALGASGPVVLALRVSLGEEKTRLTVNGHAVPLPAAEAVRRALRDSGRGWQVRLQPGFDAGFFLPEQPAAPEMETPSPETGLLLAVAGASPGSLADYLPA
ncbi:MAG: hypothetical protein ACTS10_17655 [Kiloniellales bacterium]